jgi:hypothetical protein
MDVTDGTILDVPEVDIDAAAEALIKRWSKKSDDAPRPKPRSPSNEQEEEHEEHHEEEDARTTTRP